MQLRERDPGPPPRLAALGVDGQRPRGIVERVSPVLATRRRGARRTRGRRVDLREAEEHLGRRLVAEDPNRLAAFRVETDIIENLKRIYYFAKRIAKTVARVEMQYLEEKPAATPQAVGVE